MKEIWKFTLHSVLFTQVWCLYLPIVQFWKSSQLKSEIIVGKESIQGLIKVKTMLHQEQNVREICERSLTFYSDEMLQNVIQQEENLVLLLQRRTCMACIDFVDHYNSLREEFKNHYVFASATVDEIPEFITNMQHRLNGRTVQGGGKCGKCAGSGSQSCPTCFGEGFSRTAVYTVLCSTCGGKGKIRCDLCGGKCLNC